MTRARVAVLAALVLSACQVTTPPLALVRQNDGGLIPDKGLTPGVLRITDTCVIFESDHGTLYTPAFVDGQISWDVAQQHFRFSVDDDVVVTFGDGDRVALGPSGPPLQREWLVEPLPECPADVLTAHRLEAPPRGEGT